jgi:ribosomal protein S18 acetylase RimI-like enzyme
MDILIEQLKDDDAGLKRFLQEILNQYHAERYPKMKVPEAKEFSLRVVDQTGELVGGAMFWIYWNWVEISLLALKPAFRDKGLGRRALSLIESQARLEGCKRIKTDSFAGELGFYQKMGFQIVGKLEDYPEGLDYFYLRKDLE